MRYIEPKCVDDAFHDKLLQDIKTTYLSWVQSGWKSSRNANEYGHGQHYIGRSIKHICVDLMSIPGFQQYHPHVTEVFNVIQEVIGPRKLFRVYAKSYHYGQDAYPHTDMTGSFRLGGVEGVKRSEYSELVEDFETVIIYLSKDWKNEYFGQTILYTEDGEVDAAMNVKYGRTFIFDSAQLHSSAPLSRITPINKDILVFNTMPLNQSDDGFDYLKEHTKDYPHSGKTFFEHLWNVFSTLGAMKAPKDVCLAGFWHAAYGTASYQKHDKSKFTRKIVRGFIGVEAEKLVHEFCSMSPRTDPIIEGTNIQLKMIEYANLVDQNPDGVYNDKIEQLLRGITDETGRLL